MSKDNVKDIQYGRRIFTIEDVTYSIRVPILEEINESKLEQAIHYNNLLRDVDEKGNNKYLTRDELINLHKQRGIDVEKARLEIKGINSKLTKELLELAKIMNKEDLDSKISALKSKIKDYKKQVRNLLAQEARFYTNSIESLAEEKFNYALMSRIIEKRVDNTWAKYFIDSKAIEKDKNSTLFIKEFVDFYYGYKEEIDVESPFV